jgi:hypothetical protein
MKPIRFKRFHDWLIRLACNERYWGKMKKEDFNFDKRTIQFGFYGLGYSFLDPFPKFAVSCLVHYYQYKPYQQVYTFPEFKENLIL